MIAGDISWAMKLEQTYTDFKYIDDLPGKKIFLKGNHDYWWGTKSKIEKFLDNNKLNSINILLTTLMCATIKQFAVQEDGFSKMSLTLM